MTPIKQILLILPLLLLTACDNLFLQTQTYTLIPPPTPAGQTCARQCPVIKSQCVRSCEAMRNTCTHNAQLGAKKSYLQYVNDRMGQGLLVDKKESEFYADARNCPTLDNCQNGCDINQRRCHENCGGQVNQNGNCLANCTGAPPESSLGELADWFSEKPE